MNTLNPIQVLVAVRLPSIARYREHLVKDPKLKVTVVTSEASARAILNDSNKQTDVFVVDNGLGDVFEWIKELRRTHPRLLILLVDEEADFGMPGRADDVSTEPFKEDDMIKKIKRMAEEDLGYDHVIFYAIAPGDPPALTLAAQVGPNAVTGIMPIRTDYTGILGWVAQNGQSKIIGPGDTPSHILIERGRYGAAVCVPVGLTLRLGVMIAFREQPGTIKQEDIVMLELVCAQLASALAKEQHS
jgi:GAF domain-containing protein